MKSHLYVALDNELIVQADFDMIYKTAAETESLISGLMKYLVNSDQRGRKFNREL